MKIMHLPVLTGEIVEMLQIKKNGIYLDGTLGDGGHAEQILSALGPRGLLVAFEQDKDSISFAEKRLQPFKSQTKIFHDNFKNARKVLAEEKIGLLDGILLDLGVSSRQLENPERGFSFASDAFLDMRMDQRTKTTAFDLLNNSSENELATIFKEFGEERWAKRIARAIVRKRETTPIRTTGELSKLILSVVPAKSRKYRIHPATRVFQALRIAVNKELKALSTVLDDGVECLKPSGRFCVISFHSLEDRLVKTRFRQFQKGCICPIDIPQCVCGRKSVLKVITKKPIVPTEDEVKKNPRARSAKLRVAEKVG
ncbi:MAG TPA: 16S rRNA (cytosine(1402)-N(4))-methyltransferase RsmH [Nitrospinota bacterium]|nr:16S rRNA (cytosine(1402)-N(4))-methyltransferase RsmH [Nitrospinota bacterium]